MHRQLGPRRFQPRKARQVAALFGMLLMATGVHASPSPNVRQQLYDATCRALRNAAQAVPGNGPMLLPSYPTLDAGAEHQRSLRRVAFVYDNALAGIALTACGAPRQAQRIADALLRATAHDTSYDDGRLRNAYRAGPLTQDKAVLSGYWDERSKQWVQDAYQVGTATGNVAWAALLFLTVYEHTHAPRYLDAAVGQLRWIRTHAFDPDKPLGYEGGRYGFDGRQQRQRWKSTEHNLDVHAAATWASRYRKQPALKHMADNAGRFVQTMWHAPEHRFYIGTREDGATPSRELSALDAQIWPLLAFPHRPPTWNRVWTWVEAHHRAGNGYGFRGEPDGLWTEGTAQAADAIQASGRTPPTALWRTLLAQRADDGLLYATPQPRIATGLAIGPDSTHADFYYYHLPHLGATAWATLAADGWNPFTGRRMTPATLPASMRAAPRK
ncbi:hypothetical protein [Oleiagrimonas soli]|uniref:Methylaspartate ammonia-lyase n=1 Tax=Oleiagrimonas soli TaxID=1543381 RepID=A0A099CY05_9GAMM|nr:hypothetical protein [Oleiagrimonas soli]KGI78644.1 hypothetical protein LF63_0104170 [Oleiagrimonas soli]MBB6184052.1 hypothetical protein [Oleiagrimonas soli]